MTGGDNSKRRLAAVLFTDMEGYSRQMAADESGTLVRLRLHNDLVRTEVDRHAGRVIKTVGDAFMVEFASSVVAVTCALDIQRALAAHNDACPADQQIRIRVGVHVGDVVEEAGDLFGETVNIAARIEPKAPVGGVCVSQPVLDQVMRKVRATAESLGAPHLKNIPEPVPLYALWPAQTLLEATTAAQTPTVAVSRRWKPWAAALLLLAALTAAGTSWRRTVATPPKAHVAAAVDGRRGGTLRLGIFQDPAKFDLFSELVTVQRFALAIIVERLGTTTIDGVVHPAALERWTTSADGRTIDLFLRPGVLFHDHRCLPGGRRVAADAQDLVWSINQASLTGLGILPGGVSAVGPLHVTVKIAQRNVFAMLRLADVQLLPRALEGCEDLHNLREPVGVGPFRYAGSPASSVVRLERFNGYWGAGTTGLPWLDAVEVYQVQDANDAVRRLGAGELDAVIVLPEHAPLLLQGSETGAPTLLPRFGALRVQVGTLSSHGRTTVLCLHIQNFSGGALASPKVREAVSWGLDRVALLQAARPGFRPTGRFLEGYALGRDPNLVEATFDLKRARKLLVEAGYPGGKGLPRARIAMLAEDGKLAEPLRAQFAALGIGVDAVELERAGLQEAIAKGSIDGFVGTLYAKMTGNEPHGYLKFFSRQAGRSGFTSPEQDRLLAAISVEPDQGLRATMYADVERALMRELPTIPLAFLDRAAPAMVIIARPQVKNLMDPVSGRLHQTALFPEPKDIYLE